VNFPHIVRGSYAEVRSLLYFHSVSKVRAVVSSDLNFELETGNLELSNCHVGP